MSLRRRCGYGDSEPTDVAAPLAPLASAVAMEGNDQKRKPRENKSTVN